MIPQVPNDGNPDAWKAYLAFWLDARANMPDAIERVALNIGQAINVRDGRIKLRDDSLRVKLARISELGSHLALQKIENDSLRLTLRQTKNMMEALSRTIDTRIRQMVWEHANAFTSDTQDDGGRGSEPIGESLPPGGAPDGSSSSGDAHERAVDRQDSAAGEERPRPPTDAAQFRGDQETRGD